MNHTLIRMAQNSFKIQFKHFFKFKQFFFKKKTYGLVIRMVHKFFFKKNPIFKKFICQ